MVEVYILTSFGSNLIKLNRKFQVIKDIFLAGVNTCLKEIRCVRSCLASGNGFSCNGNYFTNNEVTAKSTF
jgi:hypothetical protein